MIPIVKTFLKVLNYSFRESDAQFPPTNLSKDSASLFRAVTMSFSGVKFMDDSCKWFNLLKDLPLYDTRCGVGGVMDDSADKHAANRADSIEDKNRR